LKWKTANVLGGFVPRNRGKQLDKTKKKEHLEGKRKDKVWGKIRFRDRNPMVPGEGVSSLLRRESYQMRGTGVWIKKRSRENTGENKQKKWTRTNPGTSASKKT